MRCLQEECVILKVAIEEAINKGKQLGDYLSDITRCGTDFGKGFFLTYFNTRSGIVGWVDDF